ncbi:MAG: hypothetical protein ABR548_08950 [Actinomycetota bacterium]
MKIRTPIVLLSIVAVLGGLLLSAQMSIAAGDTISPISRSFSYDAGPFTNANVGGLLLGSCEVPEGCDLHNFTVSIPPAYYAALRAHGQIGIVQVALTWADNADDFDLALLDAKGDPIASSGFGNSDFERINYAELPSGKYTVQSTVFRAINADFHVVVSLQTAIAAPTATSAGTGGVAFSNGTPVTLERSSGEPDMDIAPNGDIYIDFPLAAGSNSILFKSTDNGDTYKPLSPLHPNNNPLPNNVAGGGDSGVAIDADGRICFSELNTLLSLGIGCSTAGGKTFPLADSLVIDPTTPLVDRQWQAATPQGEQFITAQYGIVDLAVSHPGIRLFKETAKGTNVFTQIQEIDTGKSMKSYNMAVDPSDADAAGGTIVEAYLRSNEGPDKDKNPHELMVWQSTDGGSTVTTHKVIDLPTTPGNNFASVDIDRQGNTYVAWSEQGTWDIFYSVARKGDLDHWSPPVRVNADPDARTAIQPTIKVGDRGRVFLAYYGAQQSGNPDKLPNGAWNAIMAVSTNGACMIDADPCVSPEFHQVRITDHAVQHRGICLGGTGCGGDPYYGDRSMLEFLDVAFSPATGQAHVVVTDSSRSAGDTTITTYKQISGPSAFAGKPDIKDEARTGVSVTDVAGDAGWPYESLVPTQATGGADITSVRVSRPSTSRLRIVIQISDPGAIGSAVLLGAGTDLLIGARFATDLDVLWAGLRYTLDGGESFVAGHLENGFLVDTYTPDDAIAATGSFDTETGTITIDLPSSALKTELARPEDVPRPRVAAVKSGAPLFSVTGFAFTGVTSSSDLIAKHLLDVTPSYTWKPVVVEAKTVKGTPRSLPSTGVPLEWVTALLLLVVAGALRRTLRDRS